MGLYEELIASDELDTTDILGISNLTLVNKISGPRLNLLRSFIQ